MAVSKKDYPVFKGITIKPTYVLPDSASEAASIIPSGASTVIVGANENGVNDFIVLPALATVPDGHCITIITNAAGHEIRTPSGSNEEINSEDSDSTKEYTVAAVAQVHYFTKITTTIGWEAHGYTAIGAVVVAIVPGA